MNNKNQTYDWTQNESANVKQDNHVDTTGLQMNEINKVMKALSTNDEKQPDYEEFDKEGNTNIISNYKIITTLMDEIKKREEGLEFLSKTLQDQDQQPDKKTLNQLKDAITKNPIDY